MNEVELQMFTWVLPMLVQGQAVHFYHDLSPVFMGYILQLIFEEARFSTEDYEPTR